MLCVVWSRQEVWRDISPSGVVESSTARLMASSSTQLGSLALGLWPSLEERAAARDWFLSLKDADTEEMVCIVGGGLSGIEAAKIMSKAGRKIVVLEKNQWLGGIWVTGANPESRVQVDPVSFAPVEDASPVRQVREGDPFDSIAMPADEVLDRLGKHALVHDIVKRTVFGAEVLKFYTEDEKLRPHVNVVIRLAPSGSDDERKQPTDGVVTRRFRELHIRTGNLKCPRQMWFSGEAELFRGLSRTGTGGDIPISEFNDKRVTIVGSGAFAIENVRRALSGGARTPIRVLTRAFDKCFFPEYATYTLRHTLNAYPSPDSARDKEYIIGMWRKTIGIIDRVASACRLTDKVLNPRCIRKINGERHVVFNHGIPPMSSNLMYLACYYGLVTYEEDEIAACEEGAVVTKTSKEWIPTDLLIKCVGFEADDSLLREHVCNDAYFVNNRPNITHNLHGDRVRGTLILGPHAQCRNFLISYYEDAQEYERTIVELNDHPEAFEELLSLEPSRFVCDVSMVDYMTTIVLSDKLARLSHPAVRKVMEENQERRRAMYETYLPEEKFKALDKAYWDCLAHHFSSLAGNGLAPIAYPF